jgi:nucleotide-binding universal stress UspA family protein
MKGEAMYKRILVPIDGSATSMRGLDEAVKLAKLSGASIHLVHALDQFVFVGTGETYTVDVFGLQKEAGERVLGQGKERVAASGVPVTTYLSEPLPGRVCDVVCGQARESGADLIVLGTHGRRGIGRLLMGSDAEQVLRLAQVPVLLIRA